MYKVLSFQYDYTSAVRSTFYKIRKPLSNNSQPSISKSDSLRNGVSRNNSTEPDQNRMENEESVQNITENEYAKLNLTSNFTSNVATATLSEYPNKTTFNGGLDSMMTKVIDATTAKTIENKSKFEKDQTAEGSGMVANIFIIIACVSFVGLITFCTVERK